MSKITDYSKFDHIDIDEEDEHEIDPPPSSASAHVVGGVTSEPINPSSSTASASAEPPQHGTTKKHPSIPDRYIFSYSNQKIYEWEQSLEEVSIYIDLPPPLLNVESPASYIAVNIQATHLQVGLKGNDRFFIDEDTFDKVKVKESSWYLDEGVITIVFGEVFSWANVGRRFVWPSCCKEWRWATWSTRWSYGWYSREYRSVYKTRNAKDFNAGEVSGGESRF
eukprot:g6382.t1 g6382   contig23:333621-334289(+)